MNGPLCDARHRPGRRQGHAGGARSRQPVPRPARRPAPVVSLPPPVRRRAAGTPAGRAADRASPTCTGGPATGTSCTASGPRPSATRWPASDFARAADLIELAMPAMRQTPAGGRRLRRWLDGAARATSSAERPVLSAGYAGCTARATASSRVSRSRLQAAERWLDAGRRRRDRRPTGMVVVDEVRVPRLPAADRHVPGRPGADRAATWPAPCDHARRALDLVAEDDHLAVAAPPRCSGSPTGRSGTSRPRTAGSPMAWRASSKAGLPRRRRSGCAITLADIRLAQGRLDEAHAHLRAGPGELARPGGPVLRGAADMHVGMSRILRERNDLAGGPAAPGQSAGAGRGERPAAEPPTAGASRWPWSGRRRATWTGRSQLLDEAERLYVGDFSPDVAPGRGA